MDTNQLKKNQYLDKVNHAPYVTIIISGLIFFSLFTFLLLMGIF